ncbi:MAG: DUF1080 domain-containing protein [Bacteroidales bacterium]
MKTRFRLALLLVALSAFVACQKAPQPVSLFNGTDLAGWVPYLAPDSLITNPADVYKVKEGCIWVSGKPLGYLRTENEYTDYRLTVEWRWDGEPTNSGLFQRIALPDQTFPKAIEVQLAAGKAGDFVMLGGSKINETNETGPFPVVKAMNPTNEKAPGEWNRAEITCKGDSIIVYVNGLLQNKASGAPTSGYIGLQSEGGPIMFRSITVTPLK